MVHVYSRRLFFFFSFLLLGLASERGMAQVSEGLVPDAVELSALRDLYTSTGGTTWTNQTNWLQGATVAEAGNWHGVTVRDGDVAELRLASNNLNGTLPASLDQLAGLEHILLDDNQLTGAVPASLTQLLRLYTLSLSNNQLTDLPSWVIYWPRRFPAINVQNNYLSFGAVEQNFYLANTVLAQYQYAPQKMLPGADTVQYIAGGGLTLSGARAGNHNLYQWERRVNGTWVAINGATTATLEIAQASAADTGLYRTRITSEWMTMPTSFRPALILYSKAVYAASLDCLPLTMSASPAVTIPTGDAVILRAYPSQAEASVQWSPATGLSTTMGTTVTAAPATTTTYTITATVGASGSRCTSSVQTIVTVTVTSPLALDNPPVDGCQPTLVSAPPAPRPAGVNDSVNYVRTYTARAAYTNPARLRQAVVDSVQVRTEYLDGLGRPVQTVLRQESPGRRDVVQPMAYDALGRQPRQYLPYATDAATADAVGYRPHALAEQYNFYFNNPTGPGFATDHVARTGVPFAETMFEASALNRVLAQGAPGEAWQLTATGGHALRVLERTNTLDDRVLRFVSGYEAPRSSLTQMGPYAAGELWLVETTNEDGSRTREFKNKDGQVVWKQTETSRDQWLHTAYAYDDFGRLRAVLPPKAVAQLVAGTGQVGPAEEVLLFGYRYDEQGRVSAKQVPGTDGETQFVYDQLDRPVLSQDAQQRARAEWAFTKYDALGRIVLTGLVTRDAPATALQAEADATDAQWEERAAGAAYAYTTNQAYPRLGQQGFPTGRVLTITQYDDYNFDNDAQGTADVAYDAQYDGQLTQAPRPDARVTGLPTRIRTRVLDVPEVADGAWVTVTTFYDEKARPIQVRTINARGGEDVVTTQLDFAGKVIKSYAVHTGRNHAPLALAESFGYDHAGRLTEARQQLPGEAQAVVVAQPAYNEVGQLVRKTLAPGTAWQQRVNYAYNIRGWLTHLNDPQLSIPTDLWGLELSYDCGFAVPQYNGNIAGQKWRGQGDHVERAYGYLYDGASRLTQGDFVARNPLTRAWTAGRQNYGMSHVRYDENGNLLAVRRQGLLQEGSRTGPKRYGATDDLTYSYAGNRLTRVDDGVSTNGLAPPAGYQGAPTSLAGDFQEAGVRQADEYRYDANGNLTADANKRITNIAYNHLNLPRRVVFGTDSLVFRYAASGQKVAKLVYQTGKPLQRTDYLGAYQYEDDSLRFFPHAEGRVLRAVRLDAAGQEQVRYVREYSLKDHLGNLRLAYRPGQRARYAATMEVDPPSRARQEEQQWDSVRLASTRTATPLARSQQYAAKLNAGLGQPLGPTKLLAVQKGDTVHFTAPGLYSQPVRNTRFGFSLLGFVASLLQQPAPMPGPGADGRPRMRPLPFLGIGLGLVPALAPRGRVPKGYARVLVFNADSVLVESRTQQLSEQALNRYETLSLQVVAPENGYVTCYVGNESDVDVYFDDVQLDYGPALLVQESHYDPIGLELAGLARETPGLKPLNQYKFNGKEFQANLGLNWNHQDWRFYDPQLGRWHVVDPEAESGDQESWSTYQFGFNNAIRYEDADGRCPICPAIVQQMIIGAAIGAGVDLGFQVAGNVMNGRGLLENIDGKSIMISAGAGALGGTIGGVASAVSRHAITGTARFALKAGTKATEGAVLAGESIAKQSSAEGGEVSAGQVATDVAAGLLTGQLPGARQVDTAPLASKLKQTQVVAARNPRASRIARVERAQKALTSAERGNRAREVANGVKSEVIENSGQTAAGATQGGTVTGGNSTLWSGQELFTAPRDATSRAPSQFRW
jgi:RHS repeat-associated protein